MTTRRQDRREQILMFLADGPISRHDLTQMMIVGRHVHATTGHVHTELGELRRRGLIEETDNDRTFWRRRWQLTDAGEQHVAPIMDRMRAAQRRHRAPPPPTFRHPAPRELADA